MALSSYQLEARMPKGGNCYYCLHEGKGYVPTRVAVGNYWVCEDHQ